MSGIDEAGSSQTSTAGDQQVFRVDLHPRDHWGPNSFAWKLAHWVVLGFWLGVAIYLVDMLRAFHQHILNQ